MEEYENYISVALLPLLAILQPHRWKFFRAFKQGADLHLIHDSLRINARMGHIDAAHLLPQKDTPRLISLQSSLPCALRAFSGE